MTGIRTAAGMALSAALLPLVGCGSADQTAGQAAPDAAATLSSEAPAATVPSDARPKVDWSLYAPIVRDRIEQLEANKNCVGLQQEFDTAADNNNATRERTGKGNVRLMNYLDDALRRADCY